MSSTTFKLWWRIHIIWHCQFYLHRLRLFYLVELHLVPGAWAPPMYTQWIRSIASSFFAALKIIHENIKCTGGISSFSTGVWIFEDELQLLNLLSMSLRVTRIRLFYSLKKDEKDVLTMEFRYPMSAFQAFSIVLVVFDTKWLVNKWIILLDCL